MYCIASSLYLANLHVLLNELFALNLFSFAHCIIMYHTYYRPPFTVVSQPKRVNGDEQKGTQGPNYTLNNGEIFINL